MSLVAKSEALHLFKKMLRESRSWNNYNFREYISRRVIQDFNKNKNKTDPKEINDLIISAKKNLEIIQRQGIIQNMYNNDKLVLEFDQS